MPRSHPPQRAFFANTRMMKTWPWLFPISPENSQGNSNLKLSLCGICQYTLQLETSIWHPTP